MVVRAWAIVSGVFAFEAFAAAAASLVDFAAERWWMYWEEEVW